MLAHPKVKALNEVVPARPPGFCTGCPERPIFAAMKLVEKELGQHHVAADIGCHLFSILPPFNIGATTMGYGLGPASASAFNVASDKRAISIMGDGGFWHNGLASIGNAVFNKQDGVILIVDNYYSAATGGQDILSSRAFNSRRETNNSIVDAVKGVGAKWVRQIDRTYDVAKMRDALREALTTKETRPENHRRLLRMFAQQAAAGEAFVREAVREGKRMVKERFGVDPDVCTGDHACIRLSGCPSLSVKHTDDPLKDDPVAAVDNSCVGCGNCGEVAEAAVLCPSFYRADIIHNPTPWDFVARAAQRRDRLPAAPRRAASFSQRDAMLDVTASASATAPFRVNTDKPISLAVLAMGGQGGGVLSDWIVALAETCGWRAQSTSVPGVAQRTGATIYYIEMLPAKDGVEPVFSLMPSPGDVDVVIAAELMEAGRSMLRGLVTPEKTVLIASTHRSFAVVEKEKPGRWIGDPIVVTDAAGVAAKRILSFDMEALAAKHGSVISATMLARLRRRGRSPLSARGLRKGDRRGRQGNRAEPQGFRGRFRTRADEDGAGAFVAHAAKALRSAAGVRRSPRARRAGRSYRGNFPRRFSR